MRAAAVLFGGDNWGQATYTLRRTVGGARHRWRSRFWQAAASLAKPGIDTAAFAQSGALALTALIALVVGVGAFAPPPPVPGPPGPDKIIHFFAFAAIVLPTALVAPHHLRWVVPGAILYGAAIEVIQPYFGRQAEFLDLVADIAGVAAAAISGRVLAGLFQRSQ